MRIKSHSQMYSRIYKFVIIILIVALCTANAKAEVGCDTKQMQKNNIPQYNAVIKAHISDENIQKIFSLGRGVGSAYYHLTDLSDKARLKPYSELRSEYSDVFQNLNIMEIILDDLKASTNSHILLSKLKVNFYNSLKDQDLNQISLIQIKNSYVTYYEALAKDIQNRFSSEGSWLFALGFYSSFQLESLNSDSQSKLLLSGFNKILNSNPISLPEEVVVSLNTINNLDKTNISNIELQCLKQNIIKVTEYFGSYPNNQPLGNEIKDLIGIWEGILINSENQKHSMKLIVKDKKNIKMNIDGIAQEIMVSEVKLINNYFTFMFKPLNTEKLYIKFNAKISNNIFAGEIVDVLGQKGNWLLSKTENNGKLSKYSLNIIENYSKELQEIPSNSLQKLSQMQ